MNLDNLTQLQKAAIEGEVAKAYSTATHDSEILYRLYTILKNAPKEITPYVVGITKDLTGIKEERLDRVVLETLADEPPLWLWIEKTVADIKLSIKLASATGMVCEAEIDKKELQRKMVRSAFIGFIRKIAVACPRAARELCRHIIDEEAIELGFLEDVCFSLIPEIDELSQAEEISTSEQFTEPLFHTEFDIRNMLSFRIETEVIEKRVRDEEAEEELQQQAKDINDKMDKAIDEALMVPIAERHDDEMDATVYAVKMAMNDNDFMSEAVDKVLTKLLDNHLKSDKAKKDKSTKYAVVKEYENSVSTTLKAFETEAEAETYKDKIEKGFPELMKSCTLKVKKLVK